MRPLLPAVTCAALALASLACSQRNVFTPVDEGSSTGADEAGSGSTDSTDSDSSTDESEDTGTPPDMGMSCPPDPPPPDEIPPAPAGCEQVYLWSCESGELSETPAGWIACGEGNYPSEHYRREPVACIHEHSLPACTDGSGGCTSDADCDGGRRCLQNYGDYCYCAPPNCMSDADCGPDELCLCAAGVESYSMTWRNHCVPADCRSQADCGDDPRGCRLGSDVCGQPANAHCPTPADDCSVDADCRNDWCRWDDTDMLWTCDQPAICE